MPTRVVIALAACAFCACATARQNADDDIAAFVNNTKAIDVHAHPMAFVAAGAAADTDFDALPLDGIPTFVPPYGLRPENPAYREAQRAIYHLTGTDTGTVFARRLDSARSETMKRLGEKFPSWALDQAGIDVMLANRVAMGSGLAAPRFRWVSFVDALMLPLDTRAEASLTPDTRALYPLETKLLRRYLHDLGLTSVPSSLEAYEKEVVIATRERQKAAGAVSVKFEAAYLRSLDFEPADSAAARTIYSRGGVPSHADYRLLEDHLFRVICREAGHLGLAVQIHVTDGFGGFYSSTGSAPHLLESAFNDSTLRGTTFVIVHGGWPRVDETLSLLAKPNVYADISMMDLIAEPVPLVRAIRTWLAEWPEKVMFGTDGFDGGPGQGWEQVTWAAAHSARRALTAALTGMVRDGEITVPRAERLARMVMRENALKAYHLAAQTPP